MKIRNISSSVGEGDRITGEVVNQTNKQCAHTWQEDVRWDGINVGQNRSEGDILALAWLDSKIPRAAGAADFPTCIVMSIMNHTLTFYSA